MRRTASWIAGCAIVLHGTAATAAPAPLHASSVAIVDVGIVDVERGRTIGPRTVLLDAGRIAVQPPLKGGIVFTKVVQKSGDEGRPLATAGTGEQRGESGHFRQMLRKRLPIALAGVF